MHFLFKDKFFFVQLQSSIYSFTIKNSRLVLSSFLIMHLCSFFSDSNMLQLSYTIIIWCLVGPSLFSISPCLLKIVLVKMAFTKKFHISPSTHAGSRLAWRMIIVARTLSKTPQRRVAPYCSITDRHNIPLNLFQITCKWYI